MRVQTRPRRACLQEPHPARRWPRCRTRPRRACLREPHPALRCLQQPHALATAQFAARVSGKSLQGFFFIVPCLQQTIRRNFVSIRTRSGNKSAGFLFLWCRGNEYAGFLFRVPRLQHDHGSRELCGAAALCRACRLLRRAYRLLRRAYRLLRRACRLLRRACRLIRRTCRRSIQDVLDQISDNL